MKYLAYFQAYTNTYGELEKLKQMYEEALQVEGVVGLVIGTRPDCMPEELLDYLEELNKKTFLLVEYGIESLDDAVLKRINRGHDFACTEDAVRRTAARGILTGGHIILGLPGETSEALVQQALRLSELPLTTLKLHQLQLIREHAWRVNTNSILPIFISFRSTSTSTSSLITSSIFVRI